jgi:thymidylate synthase (FAD)
MNLKDKYFPILKHGFVSMIDRMGTDQDVERSARLSYNKFDEVRGIPDTRKLLRFLMRKRHTSPFEQVIFKFHVRLPIFVMRQWVRHRTASLNEISYRYTEALDLYETINPDKWRTQSKDNKQGSGIFLVEEDGGAYCGSVLSREEDYLHSLTRRVYEHRLEAGVSREQARIDLPLSIYTEMVWTMDLHNLLHFLDLRCQPDAQQEIRQYANVIAGIVKKCCPITFEAWEDYVFGAVTFSVQEMQLLQSYIHKPDFLDLNIKGKLLDMSNREIEEFRDKVLNTPLKFGHNLPDAKSYSYFQENHHEENNQMEQSAS